MFLIKKYLTLCILFLVFSYYFINNSSHIKIINYEKFNLLNPNGINYYIYDESYLL